MKNNRGFTLVEVISIIALLGLIIGITVPSIMGASTNTKKKTLQTKVDNIEKAAVLYGQDNRDKITLNIDGKDATGNILTGVELENYKTKYKYCYKDDTLIYECYYYVNGTSTTITVGDLKTAEYIEYDSGKTDILNSVDESKSLLNCEIQIYKKYGKIYAVYLAKDTEDETCWYN